MGVADHGIGDVAHEGAFHPAEAAAAHHYEAGVDVLGQVDDRLVPLFAHLKVRHRDGATGLLDLPDLLVEYLLGLAPEILAPRLGVFIIDRGRKGASDRDDVQPRAGGLGEVCRYPGREIRVRRPVGGQQDARRKGADLAGRRSRGGSPAVARPQRELQSYSVSSAPRGQRYPKNSSFSMTLRALSSGVSSSVLRTRSGATGGS